MTISFHVGILPNRPLLEFTDWISRADDLGFGGIWVADSQSVFRDAYMALTLFSQKTKQMELATGVTNIITRHPAVIAHSFATLQEISSGRAVMGVGVGESAIYNVGLKPARLKHLEDSIKVIRTLMAGETAHYEGKDIKVSWPPCKVPIVMACSGPRSLQLAGRVADGVLFQVGADPILVAYAKRNIEIGAKEAGRNISEIKLYQRLGCGISNDREKARSEARAYASVAAGTIYTAVPKEDIPEQLWQDLKRMKEVYDYQKHGDGNSRHAELITDRILDAVAIAGTPDEAIPRFQELVDLGVQNFVLPVTARDPIKAITILADSIVSALKV